MIPLLTQVRQPQVPSIDQIIGLGRPQHGANLVSRDPVASAPRLPPAATVEQMLALRLLREQERLRAMSGQRRGQGSPSPPGGAFRG
jgi:hypothetical protein